jgi:cytochrome c oxidase subunit I+III
MALTDTRPETVAAVRETTSMSSSPNTPFGSGDHTTLGRLYIGAALLLGVAGWVVNALVGASQLGDGDLLSTDAANTLFTLGRTGLVLMVVVPLLLGIATLIVPLQVGANTVAFPRAAALAFWTWLLGSGVMIVANAVDGGFGGGRDRAVDLMLAALIAVVAALVLGTVCVLATAIALRTPGMSLDRVPATTWAFLVGGSVWVLSLPVLAANALLIYLDHRYGLPSDFGVGANQWSQVSWLVGQPQIYAFVVPALGILTDAVTTLGGVRQAHRGLVLVGIGAFGALSFGAFAQPYVYDEVADHAVWAGMSLLIALPLLLLVAAWATSLRAGRPKPLASVGLSLATIVLLLLAVVAGALYVITWFELRESGAYSSGHFALVVAAGMAGAAAGITYWAPKLLGRFANEGLAKLSVLLYLGGGVLAGVPLLVLGFANRFDGLADAADALNGIAVAGSALLVLAVLVTIASLATASKGGGVADDAWGTGQTLEWATSSPPAPGNFGELAVVRSPEPVLDAAEPSKEA